MGDEPLVMGRDYHLDGRGRYVFTASFLLARGRCCGSGCRHCPYRCAGETSDDDDRDGAATGARAPAERREELG